MIAFLKNRASGERAVLTYKVRDAQFTRYLRNRPDKVRELWWPNFASFWERDICSVIELLGGAKIVEALPCLMDLLNDDSELIRHKASKAVIRIAFGHPNVSPEMLENILESWPGPQIGDSETQSAAYHIAIESESATARFIKAAGARHARFRWFAAMALGQVEAPSDELLAALSQLLFDADPEVREIAVWSIGRLGNRARDAESVLRAILGNDAHLREAVVSALIEIGASLPEDWDANGNPVTAEQTQTTELPRRPGRIIPSKPPPRPASGPQ